MRARIGTKGQVVIPKAVCEGARLQPGDEVEITLDGETVIVTPVRHGQGLAGRFAGSGMARRLLDDRGAEPR